MSIKKVALFVFCLCSLFPILTESNTLDERGKTIEDLPVFVYNVAHSGKLIPVSTTNTNKKIIDVVKGDEQVRLVFGYDQLFTPTNLLAHNGSSHGKWVSKIKNNAQINETIIVAYNIIMTLGDRLATLYDLEKK